MENQNLQLKIHRRDLIIYLATASLIIIVFFILLVLKFKQNRLAKANAEIIQQLQKKELESLNLANKQKKLLLKFKLMNHIQTTIKLKELEYSTNKKQNLETFRNNVLENFQIKDKEWDNYIEEVNQIYDNKIDKLKQDYPKLTKNDIVLIILIWHHIDIDDSCRILNLGKDTIYKRRNKMKDKLGINEDIHIDNWLISLITD